MNNRNTSNGAEIPETVTIEQIHQKHQQQISLIEQKHAETLNRLIWNYERQLKEKQKGLESVLSESEILSQKTLQKELSELKSSWTWRIGFFQTSTIRLIINFLKNPYLFVISKRYRWKNIFFYFDIPKIQPPEPAKKTATITPPPAPSADCVIEIDHGKPTLVCVLDTFTKSCFAPEFNIISPTPDNWKKVLETQNVDAIFVESAWHGNDNSWESLTSSYGGAKKLEMLQKLLTNGKKKGIPSIFWNKEDPVHFARFVDTARLFDFVFTSDAEMIPKYQEKLGHRNIFALPFAAQHKIHNPIRENPRKKTVSFAGSYYNFSFAERKLDMDILLKPSMDFGLEIYDRNYGATGISAEQYGFPEIYKAAIKGKLEYADMLKAYKDYKVFLNVNSVKYSSTMFARRVFELLACGTPVISNYAKGIINLLGEDTVFIAESEDDTRKYLEQLLGDDHFWWKKSLNGMRKVIENHTYQDLTAEIFSRTGHPFIKSPPVSFLIVTVLNSPEDARYLSDIIQCQEYKASGALFIAGTGITFSVKQQEEIKQLNPWIRNEIVTALDDTAIRVALSGFEYTHMAIFNPCHYYGKNYLRDYALAVKYADAKVMGKKESVTLDNAGQIVIPALSADYRWVEQVPTDSLVIEKSILQELDFFHLLGNNIYSKSTVNVFSLDPFNFLINGHEDFHKSPSRVSEIIGI